MVHVSLKNKFFTLFTCLMFLSSIANADIPQKGYTRDLEEKISIYRPVNQNGNMLQQV